MVVPGSERNELRGGGDREKAEEKVGFELSLGQGRLGL